jgi:peptidase inhibitor I9
LAVEKARRRESVMNRLSSVAGRFAVVAVVALLVACYEYIGPGPAPNLFLSGSWDVMEGAGTPGGGVYDSIGMRAVDGVITGSGVEYWLFSTSAYTIYGKYSNATQSFNLAIRYSKTRTATYVGTAWGADSLVGVWTDSTVGPVSSWQRVFYRMPVPPCSDSAPLLGTYNPAAPGYMVQFHESVDATAEAALLGDRYGFVVSLVYQSAPKGFAAQLSPATVAVLRCEPVVASIEHDGIVTTQ